MQVSEGRASEKGLFKVGAAALDRWPPLCIATWKRSDRLNYMLIVSVQSVLTPPQLIRPIGPSVGQEGGRTHLIFTLLKVSDMQSTAAVTRRLNSNMALHCSNQTGVALFCYYVH